MRRTKSRAYLPGSQRIALYAVGLGLWLSGALWLLLHQLDHGPDAVGVTRHPLEPWTLAVHGAFAVAGTWIFGLLWGVHVGQGWAMNERRRSGVALVIVVVCLMLSGYLLYYVGSERLRALTSIFHWTAGLALPLAFASHRVRARRRLRVTKSDTLEMTR